MTRMQSAGLALAAAWLAAAPLAASAQMVPVMPVPMVRYGGPPVEDFRLPPVATSGMPVYTPGDDASSAAAQRNVRESHQYEALLQSNPAFRGRRMQQECGSVTDPALHQNCIDTFGGRSASAGSYGSSRPPAPGANR